MYTGAHGYSSDSESHDGRCLNNLDPRYAEWRPMREIVLIVLIKRAATIAATLFSSGNADQRGEGNRHRSNNYERCNLNRVFGDTMRDVYF